MRETGGETPEAKIGFSFLRALARSRAPALLSSHGGWCWSWLLLALLFLAAFGPLLAGRNFLPFERYPNWGQSAADACGRPLVPDDRFLARKTAAPWIVDRDFVALSVFWPQDASIARSLREDRIPLWDPYTAAGVPTFDSGQFRPFNPARWPFYLAPSCWSYCATLLLELLIGGAGALLWFRKEGYDSAEALLGAAVFSLNPWVLERITILEPSAFAYLPWALLGLRQARWGDWGSLALACIPFLLMGHASHPEPCMMATGLAACHHLFAGLCGGKARWTEIKERAKVLAVVGVASALALAVLWVPLLRMSGQAFSYKKAGLPFLFEYAWRAPFALASDLFLPPALAALVLLAAISRQRGMRVWLTLAAGALLAIMPLGAGGTAVKSFLQTSLFVIPLFYFKGVLWAALAFLLPAGLRVLKEKPRLIWATSGLALVWLAIDLILAARVPLRLDQQASHPLFALASLGAGIPVIYLVARRREPRVERGLLLVAFLASPLAFPLALDHLPWNTLEARAGEAVRWLSARRPGERAVSIGWSPNFVLPPNQGQAFGVRMAEQNAAYFLNEYFQLFFVAPAPPTCVMFRSPDWRRFQQMGASLTLLPAASPLEGLAPVWKGPNALAYEVPGALGRLYFARRVAARKPGEQLATQLLNLGQGGDGVAVVETRGAPAPPSWPEVPAGMGDGVFERDDPGEVTIRCRSEVAGLLVLRDAYYPGWRAYVDGEEEPIFRVNGCFRGVLVANGDHSVRFVYVPRVLFASAAVSLLVTAAIGLGALLWWRRRKVS